MTERDPLIDTFAMLETPPLDAQFAARTGARARAELAAPPRASDREPFFLTMSKALIPALLTLAAVIQTAGTASAVAKIYAKVDRTTPE
jgi:hypothetical protein